MKRTYPYPLPDIWQDCLDDEAMESFDREVEQFLEESPGFNPWSNRTHILMKIAESDFIEMCEEVDASASYDEENDQEFGWW